MAEIDHVAYFRARAAAERELARTAPQPYIANIDSQMAERYEALCDHPQDRNVLHLVSEAPSSNCVSYPGHVADKAVVVPG